MSNPIPEKEWFEQARATLESTYLSSEEPWKQSGFSGPEDRWIALRKPVADCIDRSGSLLDIGCANGYLLQCCLTWTAERNIRIELYGVDISAKLVALARQRLSHYADRFFVENAFAWTPPKKFDFVRTELAYVPAEYEKRYIEWLLTYYVRPDGRLLIANYVEDSPAPERGLLPGCYPTRYILERLNDLGYKAIDYRDGHDSVKGRKTRVAVLTPAQA